MAVKRTATSIAGEALEALDWLPGRSENKKINEALRLAGRILRPLVESMPPIPPGEIRDALDALEELESIRGAQTQYTALADQLADHLQPGILRDLLEGSDFPGRLAVVVWLLRHRE